MDAHGTRHLAQPSRMRSNTRATNSRGTPTRRSARLAGKSPMPLPPPPTPLSIQELTSSQLVKILEEEHDLPMTRILNKFGTHMQAQHPSRPTHSTLQDFQQTKPPSFSSASDPLEADDWLRTMSKKLEIARVEEQDKVPFATH